MNYLLTGPEEYLKRQFLEKLKKSILTEKEAQLGFESFQAGETDISKILDSFNTLPFFANHRVVVIKNIDKFSAKEKESILKCLKNPLKSTTLVFESTSSELNKFLKDVSKHTKLVPCYRLKHRELSTWIIREFALFKKKISPFAANIIIELVGSDLYALKNEIEKIVSFLGEDVMVTERHIEAILGRAPYKTVFELVDLILNKKMGKAYLSMEKLLEKEKPHQILNILAWQFRNFQKVKTSDARSAQELSGLLGISWGFAKKAYEQSKRFKESDLEKNLETILEADLFIKRGIMEPRHALERALAGLRV